MKNLKSKIYSITENVGLRTPYLILLFKIKKLFNVQSLYETRLFNFYNKLISTSPQLIFDIGANVGIRTSVFSKLSKNVIALEPNPQLVKILKSRFAKSNVMLIPKACASNSSVKDFYIGDNHLVSTMSQDFINSKIKLGSHIKWNQKIQVVTVSLDELVNLYGIPDFCKIDVEGFEKDVLSGLSKKLKLIAFEFNYPSFEVDTLKCLKKLNDLGYSNFNFSIGESLDLHFKEWVSYDEINSFFELENFPFNNCYGDIYAK